MLCIPRVKFVYLSSSKYVKYNKMSVVERKGYLPILKSTPMACYIYCAMSYISRVEALSS